MLYSVCGKERTILKPGKKRDLNVMIYGHAELMASNLYSYDNYCAFL